jgi:hypothetical protein
MTTRLTDADPLTDVDRDAMTRAIAITRKESPARAAQIFDMLSSRPFERVGRFAAFSCQVDALKLTPWETAPLQIRDIDAGLNAPDDTRRIGDAARLLQRLLRAGLSRYEPSPLAALARVEAKPAK